MTRQSGTTEEVNRFLNELKSLPANERPRHAMSLLLQAVSADWITLLTPERAVTMAAAGDQPATLKATLVNGQCLVGDFVTSAPVYLHDVELSTHVGELRRALLDHRLLSFALLPLIDFREGAILLGFSHSHRAFNEEDRRRLETLATVIALQLNDPTSPAAPTLHSENGERSRFDRLLQYGNMLVLQTDPHFTIERIDGATEAILGVKSEAVLHDRKAWSRYIAPRDLRRLVARAEALLEHPSEFTDEICVIARGARAFRWLLLRAVPRFDESGRFLGWEGFGIDISSQRKTQEELDRQRRRVEALYAVARALQFNMDPAIVTLRGLRAVISATGAECGIGFLYDRTTDHLELVAAEGVSMRYIEAVQSVIQDKSLVRHCIGSRRGMLLPDIQKDPRAAVETAKIEGLHATIITPLIVDDAVLGAIAVFCRQPNRFLDADFELAQTAASHISLAALQAEFYAAQKRQVTSFATLYRLSHEVSRHTSAKAIVEQSFPILQAELGAKRLWCGLMSAQGDLLTGIAGWGPGMRKKLCEMRIDLRNGVEHLDEAIHSKQPVILRAEDALQCPGFASLFHRLKTGTIIIVPMLSLGRVIGVLLLEPIAPSVFFSQSKLPLMSSIASEIATVIVARRYEYQMAEASKLRMAGLLASGIAHNFNNLLQAVMGQASLIQMQATKGSPTFSSAGMIIESANRGAHLIRQLLAFSRSDTAPPRPTDVYAIVREGRPLYESILGADISLEVETGGMESHGLVMIDEASLQQVLSNLLLNAKDALVNALSGSVRISCKMTTLSTDTLEPTLSPGDYIEIEVSDNGTGLTPEALSHCFEPFYTTKNVDPNTGLGLQGGGLGLASSYAMIRNLGGTIRVQSILGEGSTFTILLPAMRPATDTRTPSLHSQVVVESTHEMREPEAPVEEDEHREQRAK